MNTNRSPKWRHRLHTLVPQKSLSWFIGKLAHSKRSWIKKPFIHGFKWWYAVDLREAEHTHPNQYPSFNAFFTRSLKPGVRPLAEGQKTLISPCDGTLAEIGRITSGQLFHAKRSEFSLTALLGNQPSFAEHFKNGTFLTIYLGPADYHWVHAPGDLLISNMTYVPGKLFPVRPNTVENVPGLFARNERLILLGSLHDQPFALVLVGALIVAGIRTVWENTIGPLSGNPQKTLSHECYEKKPLRFKKGQKMAHFQLGSTVILLMPEQAVSLLNSLKEGQAIQLGQAIGDIK